MHIYAASCALDAYETLWRNRSCWRFWWRRPTLAKDLCALGGLWDRTRRNPARLVWILSIPSWLSGCLDESFKNRQCPTGFLCCGQDLCNHVDNPAMRNRLNKTLQVLIGNQRAYLSPLQPNSHGNQGEPRETADIWFKIAMITVPICGIVVLLVLASFAVRMLQPMPVSTPVRASGKLAPHRTSVNEPPLLGPPKVPLV